MQCVDFVEVNTVAAECEQTQSAEPRAFMQATVVEHQALHTNRLPVSPRGSARLASISLLPASGTNLDPHL